jgi:hypothetical protein
LSTAAKSGIALLIVAGVALGALVGLQVRGGADPAPEPDHEATTGTDPAARPAEDPGAKQPKDGSAPRVMPDPPGYYLSKITKTGLVIDAMTPTLLTSLEHENVPASCPPRLTILAARGGDSHDAHVRPLFDAIGKIRLSTPETNSLAAETALALSQHWRDLKTTLDRPVTTPPIRVMYKHYPRPRLPGDCVTLHATVYTVPDQHFDQQWFREEMRKHHASGGGRGGMAIRGVLIDLRRTYQLEGGPPKLVEASLEVHDNVSLVRRAPFGQLLGEEPHEMLRDREAESHFLMLGGGTRRGLVWIDRSVGLRELDPWARAYRISVVSMREKPNVETEEISRTVVKDLIELVQRP